MKKLLRVLALAALLLGLADLGGGLFLMHVALDRAEPLPVKQTPGPAIAAPGDEPVWHWAARAGFENVEIRSTDGLRLRGYYLAAHQPSNKTAILVHGYRGDAMHDMAVFARYYRETLGYNVLMADDRAHGHSEGRYIGLGWLDRKDYEQWIEFVLQRTGPKTQIVLHGLSMGGATVLEMSGDTLPPNVKAIVSDSSFSDAETELGIELRRKYHLPRFPLLGTASFWSGHLAGYSFADSSPLEQVAKSKTPTLFVHGANDHYVPVAMAHKLFERCAAPKQLLLVPKAGHAGSFTAAPTLYKSQLKQFLAKYVVG